MVRMKILLALAFGAMLAVTGCSSDGGDSGGSAGSGGSDGAGGSGGTTGAPASSCDAICNGPCTFFGLEPGTSGCPAACTAVTEPDGQLDDECGAEMQALLECGNQDGVCVDFANELFQCVPEAAAFDDCNPGFNI